MRMGRAAGEKVVIAVSPGDESMPELHALADIVIGSVGDFGVN